jgi:hypothetical protein
MKGSHAMPHDITGLLDRLDAAVRELTWTLIDLDEDELTEAEGAWSPIEILAHIKACDDIITGRIATLLTHPHPTLQRFDERAWATIAGYAEAPVDQTLMALQRHRGEMVWQLRHLPAEAWDLTAQHEERGAISLYDLVCSFLEHEEEHIAQLDALFEDEDDDADDEKD